MALYTTPVVAIPRLQRLRVLLSRKSLDRARLAIHLSESHSSGNERVMRGIFLLQFRAHVIGGFGGEGEGEGGYYGDSYIL